MIVEWTCHKCGGGGLIAKIYEGGFDVVRWVTAAEIAHDTFLFRGDCQDDPILVLDGAPVRISEKVREKGRGYGRK